MANLTKNKLRAATDLDHHRTSKLTVLLFRQGISHLQLLTRAATPHNIKAPNWT
jgi:hypothetical protein